MIARTLLAATALAALASCSAFNKNQDEYDTGVADVGNPYGVPGYDTTGTEAGAYAPESGASANPTYAPAAYEETTPATPATPAGAGGGAAKVHTVVKGDTLWGISKKYGVSIDSIKAANNMTKDTAVLGAKLKIPAR